MNKYDDMKDYSKLAKFIFYFVEITLIASVIIIGYFIVKAPTEVAADAPSYVHPKAYYTLMLVESIVGVIACTLAKRVQGVIHIPSYMLIPFVIFLYCAIFLGEVRQFYYQVPNWDTFLHFFSAGMLGCLAFSLISILNQSKSVPIDLSPAFIAIFAFCFAAAIGMLWEIYEFSFDGLLGLNMQKFMLEDGTQLIGRAALEDTMKDIITDVSGAGIVAIVGYIAMKNHDKGWLNRLQLHFKQKHANKENKANKK